MLVYTLSINIILLDQFSKPEHTSIYHVRWNNLQMISQGTRLDSQRAYSSLASEIHLRPSEPSPIPITNGSYPHERSCAKKHTRCQVPVLLCIEEHSQIFLAVGGTPLNTLFRGGLQLDQTRQTIQSMLYTSWASQEQNNNTSSTAAFFRSRPLIPHERRRTSRR